MVYSFTTVAPPPPPPTCTLSANPATINKGQSSTLTWTTTNNPATASIDNGIGPVNTAGGNTNVSPSATTTCTLAVQNTGGTNTCQALVTVTAPPLAIFTSLLSFNGTNGAAPAFILLVQGTDGSFYGTTVGGSP